MSTENKTNNTNADFDEALKKLDELRGGVTAFILLAATDKPSKDRENASAGINYCSGNSRDLANLYLNIPDKISKIAAAEAILKTLTEIRKQINE